MSLHCPRCSSRNVRESRTAGVRDVLLKAFCFQPYRCERCRFRFRRWAPLLFVRGKRQKESPLSAEIAAYLEGARRGIAESQYLVGEMYMHGKGVSRDLRLARHWLLRASEQGMINARVRLGVLHECEGPLHNPAEAARWYRIAAEAGNEEARQRLSRLADSGLHNGVVRRPFHMHAPAALTVVSGRLQEDTDPGTEQWRIAAGRGHADAQYRLGLMLESGGDSEAALVWLRRAAEQNHREAQYRLAYVQSGLSGDENHREAFEWLCRAAQAGLAVAQYTLARLLEEGDGIKPDPQQAQEWYQCAANQGYGPAGDALLRNRESARMQRSNGFRQNA